MSRRLSAYHRDYAPRARKADWLAEAIAIVVSASVVAVTFWSAM